MKQYTSEAHDLGGFTVRRALPNPLQELVGPFVFFDHFGPVVFPPGEGIDVRPHPHIGIATVTYLFAGQILHQDSLGTLSTIDAGEVNLMTAGKGIVHSERTTDEVKAVDSPLHGIQLWLALPVEQEEIEPAFDHYPSTDIPRQQLDHLTISVIMGEAFGLQSPVKTYSPMFYCELFAEQKQTVQLESPHNEQQAVYVAQGQLEIAGQVYVPGQLVLLEAAESPTVELASDARILFFGGQALSGKRYKHWNFVSSRRERIQQAREDWQAMRFPLIPTDKDEFIPLPK